uniref:Uncharacterized protein n=1 Tax=Arundo donax TaxID=35708 RepID=A0A0A9GUS9_ARUDO
MKLDKEMVQSIQQINGSATCDITLKLKRCSRHVFCSSDCAVLTNYELNTSTSKL